MNKNVLEKRVKEHMRMLCCEIGERRVGSKENRQATIYVKKVLENAGWQIEVTELHVIDWKTDGAMLICNDQSFEVFSSNYALGCSVQGELVAIDTISQLEQIDIKDKLVLLYGEIASQQIAPKKFPFWNPEEHQRIIAMLEHAEPAALVCVTERNSATAGGCYPFPLFEDGDFNIPSVYMKDSEGNRLLACSGQIVRLESKAIRIPETAFNVIGRRAGMSKKRIVITAHIDTKIGTPGAIDNGTGVTTILLLADLLKDMALKYSIELVIFNGEDYYAAPGQVKYIEQNAGKFDDILININIDGVGYKDGLSCFSPLELPVNLFEMLHEVILNFPGVIEGLPWYQGDHSLFLQNGIPAIAISSQWLIENFDNQELTHTPKDNLGIVNFERVVECAIAIAEFIHAFKSCD